jgi:DNA-binding transcriptional regulator of glucitol operon
MHVTLLVLLPTFAWLTWWQFERAYNGNTLSWAYTFEWPLFGGYAIYVWWQLIHDDPTVFTRSRQGARRGRDGELLGPEEQPGWALNGGRRARRRATRVGTAMAAADATTGAATMVDSAASQPVPGSVADHELTEVEDADEEDPELAEYNRYLADLNAGPDRKRW